MVVSRGSRERARGGKRARYDGVRIGQGPLGEWMGGFGGSQLSRVPWTRPETKPIMSGERSEMGAFPVVTAGKLGHCKAKSVGG